MHIDDRKRQTLVNYRIQYSYSTYVCTKFQSSIYLYIHSHRPEPTNAINAIDALSFLMNKGKSFLLERRYVNHFWVFL
jgi:hypothetical protein